nr:helix-turn-helix transcriptional regulator [Streptomyces sp. NBC_01465]
MGEFLRSRRSRIKPEDVGVASYGTRRVPGLRREELAQLAGVSATYYTRLEQGQSTRASESVIESLARALGLSEAERAHLHDLARPAPSARARRAAKPARAGQGVKLLLDAVGAAAPAVVLGLRHEVLAWNSLGHLLLAGHLDAAAPSRPADRPNLTTMLFLDPHTRDLYERWHDEARCAVAALRVVAGRHRGDPELAGLIGRLSLNSPEFAALWSRHAVAGHGAGVKRFRHPEVGTLELRYESLLVPEDSGQRVLMYFADPGTPSQAALQLLAGGQARADRTIARSDSDANPA